MHVGSVSERSTGAVAVRDATLKLKSAVSKTFCMTPATSVLRMASSANELLSSWNLRLRPSKRFR